MSSNITLTFCEQGENDPHMERISSTSRKLDPKSGMALPGTGFTLLDLQKAVNWCKNNNLEYELWDLKNIEVDNAINAYLLIVKKFVDHFCDQTDLYTEVKNLEFDTKSKNQYGKVVNKIARHNICFANFSQEPDYDAGKGRIVNFEDVPMVNSLRENLVEAFGWKAEGMMAEGNLYYNLDYDSKKGSGIGWHGDAERRRVIGVRLGAETGEMNLCYRWYHRWQPVSDIMEFTLGSGDVYVMSEKAVGTDYRSSSIYTLRHSAGAAKYTT